MIIIETKLKEFPETCSKCRYSYKTFDRYCGVAYDDYGYKACPEEDEETIQNYGYRRPIWCPLKR